MDDSEAMDRAIALASAVRTRTSPNPWVGCVVLAADGAVFDGATQPPGGPHAEAVALAAAGPAPRGPPSSPPSSRARTTAAPRPAPTR